MNDTPTSAQVFEWPRWALAYTYLVAIPMVFISLGIGVRIIYDYRDIFSEGSLGTLLLLISFLLAFIIGALMFAVGAQRVLNNESEALTFTASGHLMLLLPTLTILLVEFWQYENALISDLNKGLTENRLTLDMIFIVWLLVHAYFALILAFMDNTTRFLEFE